MFLGVQPHDKKVSNNRYILNGINCVRSCGVFELTRDLDENETQEFLET